MQRQSDPHTCLALVVSGSESRASRFPSGWHASFIASRSPPLPSTGRGLGLALQCSVWHPNSLPLCCLDWSHDMRLLVAHTWAGCGFVFFLRLFPPLGECRRKGPELCWERGDCEFLTGLFSQCFRTYQRLWSCSPPPTPHPTLPFPEQLLLLLGPFFLPI